MFIFGLISSSILSILKPVLGKKAKAEVLDFETVGRSGSTSHVDPSPQELIIKMYVEFQTEKYHYVRTHVTCIIHPTDASTLDRMIVRTHLSKREGISLPIYYNKLFLRHICLAKDAFDEIEKQYEERIEKETPKRDMSPDRVVTKSLIFIADTGKYAKGSVIKSELTGEEKNSNKKLNLELKITDENKREHVLQNSIFVEDKFIPHLQPGCMVNVYYFPHEFDKLAIVIPENVKIAT